MALAQHSQTWAADTERAQTLVQGSVELFAFPWGRIQPYVCQIC